MKTKVVEVWCALVMSAVLAGCADHNFDWEDARSENPQYFYERSFEAIYGAIDPNQNWDFSSLGNSLDTRGDGDVIINTTNGLDFGVTNSISGSSISTNRSKNNTIYTKINNNTFTVGNATQGLTTPATNFVIYPVATKTTQKYTMYAKVGNNQPVSVFTKDWTKNPSNNDGSVAYCNKMGVEISSASEKIADWVNEGTVYTIENVNHSGKFFNGKEATGSSQNFIVVEKYGHRYLMGVDWNTNGVVSSPGFLRMDYTERYFLNIRLEILKSYWPDLEYSDLSNASPIISDLGSASTILIGNWYIWSNKILSYYTLGIKRSAQNSNSYKWNWHANNTINETVKAGITNLLTVSNEHISKWANMPALSITANAGDMLDVYIEVDGSTRKFSTSNGKIKYLTGIDKPQEMYDESGNLLPGLDIQYFGVDLDEDGTYNDLVFAMMGSNIPQFQPISKRYFVEDMGFAQPNSKAVKDGLTDIDFNDIVIDFETTMNASHQLTTTATIRALGGTWDFVLSLKNGDVLTPLFCKGQSTTTAVSFGEKTLPAIRVNTQYPIIDSNFTTFNVGTIYNTGRSSQSRGDNHHVMVAGKKTVNGTLTNAANWDESWLCKIENVQGWDYASNNLVFTLIDSEADSWNLHDLLESSTDVNNVYFKSDYQFAFPAIGACPKIVAFDTNKEWKQERVHVDKAWFERTHITSDDYIYDYDYNSGSDSDSETGVIFYKGQKIEGFYSLDKSLLEGECETGALEDSEGKYLVFDIEINSPVTDVPEFGFIAGNHVKTIFTRQRIGEGLQNGEIVTYSFLIDKDMIDCMIGEKNNYLERVLVVTGKGINISSIKIEDTGRGIIK